MTSTVRCSIAVLSLAGMLLDAARAQDIPSRIILNLTDHPATSMAVTWRTLQGYPDAAVQLAEATTGSAFAKAVTKTPAVSASLDLRKGRRAVQSSAVLRGLRPNTVYAYRVGHDSVWSEWNQFRTAHDSASAFSFVFFGDPQEELREHVSRVFRQAFAGAGGASFWLFTGDLTDDPDDGLWQEWFDAAGFIPRMIPSIMSPGNHDHASVTVDGKKERTQELPLWRPQFTLPENGVAGLEELSYVVDYQGVRFLMLNSNDELERQAAWADSVLARNPNHWTVAAFHHPFYSSGRTRDGKTTRVAFQEVFERRGVDLVLQGHDHTYARSKKLLGGKVVGDRDRGIVYVVSSCGPKTYVLQPLYRELMATMGENQQLYQVVSVANNTLQYNAMTAIGTLFDAFELTK